MEAMVQWLHYSPEILNLHVQNQSNIEFTKALVIIWVGRFSCLGGKLILLLVGNVWFIFSVLLDLEVILWEFLILNDLIYLANFVDWNLIAIASLKPGNQVLILCNIISLKLLLFFILITVLHFVLKINKFY